jgi:alcohol dehydrogenase class IV
MNFDFFSVPRIVFGVGAIFRLGELAAPLGRRALLVFNGPESLADRASNLLKKAALHVHISRQRGEPTVEDIDRALALARGEQCDMTIGLGGGSAIDAAKAVAGLVSNGGAALDYMEVVGKGQKITQAAAPWIAVPTTAGAGAEVTRNAVIGAPDKHFKASIRGEQLLARVALVDPELAVDVPPSVTASSGMDALCQCIEAYTSSGAQPMTDAVAMRGIKSAAGSLERAVENGRNIDARQGMALAALLSGIALTNAGLGAVHGFAAPLGANFPVPHGTICAALLPHVIAANVDALRLQSTDHPTLARYAEIGRALTGDATMSNSAAIEAAVNRCGELARKFEIPPLRKFGVSTADVEPMVELARKASSMRYNPIQLTPQILADILHAAI